MTSENHILLINPPGWSLNCGGPHIGLPLLKGYLQREGIPTVIKDINLDASLGYDKGIREQDLLKYFKQFDADLAWDEYLKKVSLFQEVGQKYGGSWSIKSGFVFDGCNIKSSQNIDEYSEKESPFTRFYNQKLIAEIEESQPKIVGLSSIVPSQLLSSFEIAKLLRKQGYDGLLILGGNTPTRIKDSINCLVFEIFDAVILNQGEETLKELYKAVETGRSIKSISNLLIKDNGKVQYTGYKKLEKKDFAMPDFEGYTLSDYWGINYLTAIGARGCYYGKCSFCTIPFSWGNQGFVGYDQISAITNYLIDAKERYGLERFSFVEESMNPKRIEQLSQQLIGKGEKISFEGYARFEKSWLDPALLKTARKAGLRKLFMGLETISSRAGLHKNDAASDAVLYLKALHDAGIKVHLFTMYGYPRTSIDDGLRTVEFLFENKELIDTVDLSHFVFDKHTNHPGTIPSQKITDDWSLSIDYLPENNTILSSEEARTLARELECVVLREKPEWTNPLYRMISPWV